MTARKNLRRVLLAALLCFLLAAAALAADTGGTTPPDTIESAKAKLEQAVAKGETSFFLKLPSDASAPSYIDPLQEHILQQEGWFYVSPRVSARFAIGSEEGDLTLTVTLRYADGRERYAAALEAAYAACIRDEMSPVERAASIYSYLSESVRAADGYDTACQALVEGRADSFGFAAAYRALAEKAGLTCAAVYSEKRAWNTVALKSGTYYVDVSRAGEKGVPGNVNYRYLLFGSDTAQQIGYEKSDALAAADCEIGFRRNAVYTPLMPQEEGFWFIAGNRLFAAPYGRDFDTSQGELLKALSDASSNAIQAAVMAEDVVYYTFSIQGEYALYSWTPGMDEAEARETGLTGNYGLRLENGRISLVQNGETAKTMPRRQYFFAAPGHCYARDAGVPLAEAEFRLLGAVTDGARVIAAFYSEEGRMLAVRCFDAAEAFRLGALPDGCAEVRLFAVDAAARPIAAAASLSSS